jgi:adenylate kinase
MFREIAERETAFGREIANWINKGIQVPNRVVFRLLKKILTNETIKRGFILDGTPRNTSQLKWLDKELAERSTKIDYLIYLKMTKPGIVKRLSGRRVCPKCARNYNLLTMPPKKDELCDDCHRKLVIREDETPQAIATRLNLYYRRTAPMIEYYKEKNKVVEINGEQSVEAVFREIVERIGL